MNEQLITLAGQLAGKTMFDNDLVGVGLKIDAATTLVALLVVTTGCDHAEVHRQLQESALNSYKQLLSDRSTLIATNPDLPVWSRYTTATAPTPPPLSQ